MLGTINADGTPHLVPITYAVERDVLYTAIDHKPKRTTRLRRLANIGRDPHVSVLVNGYDDSWTDLWWCRLDGAARIVPSGEEFDAGVASLSQRYAQYLQSAPPGPLISVDVVRWTGWRGSAS